MKIFSFLTLLLCPLLGDVLEKTEIQERLAKVEAAESDPVAVKAAGVWKEALEAAKSADASLVREKELRVEIERLDSLKPLELPQEPEGELQLAAKEAFLEKLKGSIQANEDRRKEIKTDADRSPKRVAALIEEATNARAALNELNVPALAPGEIEAASHQKSVQEKRRLESRLVEIATEQELLRRESTLYPQRIARRKDHAKKLEDLAAELGEEIEADRAQEALKNKRVVDALEEKFSGISELAAVLEEIREFRQQKERLENGLREARAYSESVVEVRKKIDEQFTSAKARIELLEEANLEIDDETGVLLRRQRARLPSVDEISTELKEKLELAARAELSLMTLSDEINEAPSLSDETIEQLIAGNPAVTQEGIDQLLGQRASLLRGLDGTLRKLEAELTRGTEEAKLTIAEVKTYSGYIDERLLWIKSTKALHWREPVAEWGRVINLFREDSLGAALRSIEENLFEEIALVILVLLVSIAVFLRRGRLRILLEESSRQAVRRNCTSIMPTFKYVGGAALLSSWFSLPVWCASELIIAPVPWKIALLRLATFLFSSSLFLKFTRPHGLFVSHFKMDSDRAALLNKNFKWFAGAAPPFVFLVPALTLSEENTEAGRVVFILAMLMMAGFLHHLFHPKRTILGEKGAEGGFPKLAYVLMMALPFVFVIGASLGYFASVLTLRDQVGATAILLIFAFLVIRFLTRWTLVSRRRLAISQALRRREAAIAHREAASEGQGKNEELPSPEEVKAEAVDVVEVEAQTKQLLRLGTYAAVIFGLWVIWSSTLPALRVLDQVELWKDGTTQVQKSPGGAMVPNLTGGTSEEESGAAKKAVNKIVPADDGRVTLQDLLLTVVFFALTFIGARNIPSLLSLTLFNRIKLGPGGNFALTTTVRYLIVLVGIVVALAQIGVTWGKVQWLAAAVSLGIGFGLQEIFANFVAGIILLFERPIRLGDVVTVGEISGKVTQIKIRATTIQQFNNRELLVPNKEFITSQLVNWTLKDSVLRFEIPVGIAYGSDTEEATRILREVVDSHEKVMKEPGANVFFMSFGNSTLDFQVRGFVAAVEDLLATQSELHYQIDNAFRKAGIEIAFPQQDIHLRSLPEGMTLPQ